MSLENYLETGRDEKLPVGIIALKRADNERNQIDAGMLDALAQALEAVRRDPGLRGLVILSAREKVFSTGADIEGAFGDGNAGQALELSRRGAEVFGLLTSLPCVSVACLSGFALGGGLELALCADFRLAAKGARLGLPEVNLGLLPGWGGTQRLPRLIGRSRALRAILSGDMLSSDLAFELGLVNEVVESYGELLPAALKLLAPITQKSRRAVAAIKEAVYGGEDLPLAEALALESRLFSAAWDTPDRAEGIAALRGKRRPVWPE